MAGMFELFIDSDSSFRFRLTAPDGTVMALSKSFPDKRAAVAGIADVREYAGMGHITELPAPPPSDGHIARQERPATAPAGAGADKRRVRVGGSGTLVRLPRVRIPSAARVLGARFSGRNQRTIMRWRPTLETGTAAAELRPC